MKPHYATADDQAAAEMTETELQRLCAHRLRSAGWVVKVLASDKRQRKGAMGLPDALAFRCGVTLLLEFKSETGQQETSQVEFEAELKPHLGDTLHYILVYFPQQLAEFC